MSQDPIAAIHARLAQIDAEYAAKIAQHNDRRERAIALAHFIADLIDAIAPGQVKAEWMGSYTDPHVSSYVLEVSACHVSPWRKLVTWEIDTTGQREPLPICEGDIITAVANALAGMRI